MVSPIDTTGHPQLARVLSLGRLTKRRRGWRKLVRTSEVSPIKTDFVQPWIEPVLRDLVKLRARHYSPGATVPLEDLVKPRAQPTASSPMRTHGDLVKPRA
jgi:hypothetical protein